MKTTIEEIHLSFVNGQNKQAHRQIKEYGLYDFFDDYSSYLYELYCALSAFEYLRNAINIYMRIENR
jgi:hypothetical protein